MCGAGIVYGGHTRGVVEGHAWAGICVGCCVRGGAGTGEEDRALDGAGV